MSSFYNSFCSKNNNVFENTLATTVHECVINKLVKLTMLWKAGPRTRKSHLDVASSEAIYLVQYLLSASNPFNTSPVFTIASLQVRKLHSNPREMS